MKIDSFKNNASLVLSDIKNLDEKIFYDTAVKEMENGARIISYFGASQDNNMIRLYIFLAHDKNGSIKCFSQDVKESFSSLTPKFPQAHLFEREIFEQFNIIPLDHPWLKPVRFSPSLVNDSKPCPIGDIDYLQVNSLDTHEVAVGPVHAGIIEPGHFRFSCYGEKVLNLEISLGYQHRGVEKKLINGPDKRTYSYMQTLCGDTTIGHTLAYVLCMEALSDTKVPKRAEFIRTIALELERLANHVGDLGALANDVGYLTTTAYCGRLRGDFLNMTALICGSRLGRELLCVGGVNFDLDNSKVSQLIQWLTQAIKDVEQAVNLLWHSSFVLNRFEGAGRLDPKVVEEFGIVGLVARASGIRRDIRKDFPLGIYQEIHLSTSGHPTGDVYARAYVRFLEIQRSANLILSLLQTLPAGEIVATKNPLHPSMITTSLVEGWRGEICHTMITDQNGKISRYKVVDPSFHNWIALSLIMKNEEIFNFPLCNKSFNLSYCGHDL